MKSIHLFCMAASLLFFFACKQNPSQVEEEKSEGQPAVSTNNSNEISGGHDYTFLTDQLFHYDAVNIIGKEAGENPYKDQWIDLMPDGTYKAGTLKEQTHTGKWDYNHEQKVLQLRPEGSGLKMSEWKVMHNNDMMVWVGTQTFGNNATQIKLIRSAELPQGD